MEMRSSTPAGGNAAERSVTSATSTPTSFQFSVASEEGINLVVDLNFSLSSWVNSFKNEISIQHSMMALNPGSSADLATGMAGKANHFKVSSGQHYLDICNKFAESSGCCTASSVSSIVSVNCQSKSNAATESSPLTLLNNPVESCGLQNAAEVASHSCRSTDIVNSRMNEDIASCPSALNQDFTQDMSCVPQKITSTSAVKHPSYELLGSLDANIPVGSSDAFKPTEANMLKKSVFNKELVGIYDSETDVARSSEGVSECEPQEGLAAASVDGRSTFYLLAR